MLLFRFELVTSRAKVGVARGGFLLVTQRGLAMLQGTMTVKVEIKHLYINYGDNHLLCIFLRAKNSIALADHRCKREQGNVMAVRFSSRLANVDPSRLLFQRLW